MAGGLLFIGGRRRGAVVLESLLRRGDQLAGCIIMKDDPHEPQTAPLLERMAEEAGIPFVTCKSIGQEQFESLYSAWQPDIAIAENWRTMIRREVYERFRAFAVLHEAMLPSYRGFAPLAWQLINGERSFGVTMFHIASEVDAGDIIEQREIQIDEHDTANDLYEKTIPVYADMIARMLPLLSSNQAPRIPQEHSSATFACSRNPNDGCIDWQSTTQQIYNLVRALAPPIYPGAWTTWAGSRLTICSAMPVSAPLRYVGRIAGRVVQVHSGAVHVLTGEGILEVRTVRTEQGDVQPAANVLRSVRAQLGAAG